MMLLSLLLPFVLAVSLCIATIRLAHRRNLYESVREDRWHTIPTPKLGGIALCGGTVFSGWLFYGEEYQIAALLMGGILMFVLGLVDDLKGMHPQVKLIAQVSVALFLILLDVRLHFFASEPLNILLTLLWIVGITNAFNLLDNIDGLSAGVCTLASFCFAILFFQLDAPASGMYALFLFSASVGFLLFNFRNAKIFMGDSGSLFIGFTVSLFGVLFVEAEGESASATSLFIPLFLLALPLFDTIFVSLTRTFRGISIAQGGRDHLSHRVVRLGMSDTQGVLLLYALSVFFSLIGFVVWFCESLSLAVLLLFALLVLCYKFGVFLCDREIDAEELKEGEKLRPWEVKQQSEGKKKGMEVIIDIFLITASLFIANTIRFGVTLDPHIQYAFLQALPWIIAVKLATFYGMGIYDTRFEYINREGLLLVVKAVSLSSLLLVVGVTMTINFINFSRSVVIIDWVILSFLLLSSRMLLKGIRTFFFKTVLKGHRSLILSNTTEEKELALLRAQISDAKVMGIIAEKETGHNIGLLHDIEPCVRLYAIDSLYLDMKSLTPEKISGLKKRIKTKNLKLKLIEL